jgi:ATP-dependent DNA helicase RecG
MSDATTEDARERLEVMAATSDGFAIAEADLRLRGPGEMLGQDQSGLPGLRFGDLRRDAALIERARALARGILGTAQVVEPRGR